MMGGKASKARRDPESLPYRPCAGVMVLNGDGLVDAADHAGDYAALPVVVRVEWTGQSGPARVEIRTTLGAF